MEITKEQIIRAAELHRSQPLPKDFEDSIVWMSEPEYEQCQELGLLPKD